MSLRPAGGPRPRRNRGRPAFARGGGGRRALPTQARVLALRVLERVQRAGAFADVLLHVSLSRSTLPAPDRAFATDLVYGTLRWRGRIDHLLRHVLDRDLDRLEPFVATALRLGAYQLLFAEVPPNAAVDQSVRCVRAVGAERATGLVNAVLRRLASEHDRIPIPALEDDAIGHLVHALSIPGWIAERWIARYGAEEAAALARASNAPPPLTVRANASRGGREALLPELAARFPEARPCRSARHGIVLGRRGNAALDPAFLAGHFAVQDEGSQLVVGLLDPRPGERVLDVCAAPGGKATAIAERLGGDGRVLALDRNARRLDLVRREARRLRLSGIAYAERDVSRPLRDLAEQPFDRVLLDAPCSGLGTLRRNPDARWRLRPEDVSRLAETQRQMLASTAQAVRPGGVLVYATCTLAPEENEDVVRGFLERAPDFRLPPADSLPAEPREVVAREGFLRCLPHVHDSDGFFAARLERSS